MKTVGDLRKVMEDLSDDFKIDFRVRHGEFETIYLDDIEFDDIGWADKDFCIGVTIPDRYKVERK